MYHKSLEKGQRFLARNSVFGDSDAIDGWSSVPVHVGEREGCVLSLGKQRISLVFAL